jgi:hypothetical protein
MPGNRHRRSSFNPFKTALTSRPRGGKAISWRGGGRGFPSDSPIASDDLEEFIVEEESGVATPASLQIFKVSASWLAPSFQNVVTRDSIFSSNNGGNCEVKSAPSLPIEAEKKTQESNASRKDAESSI